MRSLEVIQLRAKQAVELFSKPSHCWLHRSHVQSTVNTIPDLAHLGHFCSCAGFSKNEFCIVFLCTTQGDREPSVPCTLFQSNWPNIGLNGCITKTNLILHCVWVSDSSVREPCEFSTLNALLMSACGCVLCDKNEFLFYFSQNWKLHKWVISHGSFQMLPAK